MVPIRSPWVDPGPLPPSHWFASSAPLRVGTARTPDREPSLARSDVGESTWKVPGSFALSTLLRLGTSRAPAVARTAVLDSSSSSSSKPAPFGKDGLAGFSESDYSAGESQPMNHRAKNRSMRPTR